MKLLHKRRLNVKTQNAMTFKNVFFRMDKNLIRIKPKCGSLSTFLTQNTDKATPGHSRSPGTNGCLKQISNLADWFSSKSLIFNELQQLNTIYKSIIIHS
jgi:hypothetical protein